LRIAQRATASIAKLRLAPPVGKSYFFVKESILMGERKRALRNFEPKSEATSASNSRATQLFYNAAASYCAREGRYLLRVLLRLALSYFNVSASYSKQRSFVY
jgi:hypothetical protein